MAEKTVKYLADLCIEGEFKTLTDEQITIGVFVNMYHVATDVMNSCLKSWNAQFETKFPDKDGYSEKYEDFIREKQEDIIHLVNNRHRYNRVQLFIGEHNQIRGRARNGAELWFDVHTDKVID